MKEIIIDLRNLKDVDGEIWADHPAFAEMQGILIDNADRVIRIKITKLMHSYYTHKGEL